MKEYDDIGSPSGMTWREAVGCAGWLMRRLAKMLMAGAVFVFATAELCRFAVIPLLKRGGLW